MTGPTASISTTAASTGALALPSLLSVGAPQGAPGAVPSLAAFVDLMLGQPAAQPDVAQPDDDRQADAATGNSLPDETNYKDKAAADLAWLLAAPVVPLPVPTAPVVTTGGPATPTLDAQPEPLPIATLKTQPINTPATLDPLPTVDPLAAPDAAAPLSDATPVAIDPATPRADTPRSTHTPPVAQPAAQIIAATMLRTPQPAPTTLARATATAQPAIFALAMGRQDKDDEPAPVSPATTAAALLQPADAAALIAKPGEAQRQALDMGRPDWPQKMIDRIESLRDSADANDTSIRLKPDALGRVDVSLKTQADGAVAVRFTAEQPTTRALLADATPQLTAAAEARGIRLAQTSVDLSGSGQDERQRPQFERQQPTSNRLAPSEAQEAATDGRIA